MLVMNEDKKKKILIVAHHLTVGGVQKSLISALKAIDYGKYDVTLYLRKNRLDLLPLVDQNVHIIVNKDETHYYRKPVSVLLQIQIMLYKLVNQQNKVEKLKKQLADKIREMMMRNEQQNHFANVHYDVAISYVQGYTTLFVADYINADKKVVFYQVSTDELHEVHEKTLPKYDKVVVEHEDIKVLMEEWYPETQGRVEIIENYVDSEIIHLQSKEHKVDTVPGKVKICSCGRFAKVKGFDMAVKAANILKNNGVEFVWYMVGDGPERTQVEQLIEEYKLQDYVVLTGMQTNPYPYIASSDIYVQPSYEEALSIAILEAQILCMPIVTTKTVGGISMIRDGIDGVLVDINEDSLAEALEELINNVSKRENLREELRKIDYEILREQYKERWNHLLQ